MPGGAQPVTLEFEQSLGMLRSWLEPRRALFPKGTRFAFATLEGERFTLEPDHPELVHRAWAPEDASVVVLTSQRTISDLLLGDFDPRQPGPEHLFLWAGALEAWKSLQGATHSASSARSAQLGSLSKGR